MMVKYLIPATFLIFALLTPDLLAQKRSQSEQASFLFSKPNLAAWCIVPFDAAKRSPEERAEMLHQLGFTRLAYDYRAEHIPTFEREILALRKHKIELFAWWFPTSLNDEAKLILEVLRKNNEKPQLWVTGGGDLNMNPEQAEAFCVAEVERIRTIAIAANEQGCQVGLYNHGGWFGEPKNQVELIRRLKMPNVGIVYNLHHAHDQLGELASNLSLMRPYLIAVNLNGTETDGDKIGKKILPIGQGNLDRSVLKTIIESGYVGPIGILNHTDEDAKLRLEANLNGLQDLVGKLDLPK
ncbi:MAG: sugar phosphate isomerase/epimerase family protein [Pirellula sp.]